MKKQTFALILITLILTPTLTPAVETINIANPPTTGNGWLTLNNTVTITQNGTYLITGQTTENRLAITAGISATITLHDCSITNIDASPLALSDNNCKVLLRLEGTNHLSTANLHAAGLNVPGTAQLTIEGPGSLTATGLGSTTVDNQGGGAGIGGNDQQQVGTILINSGTITANGGVGSAGIGGAFTNGGTVQITGGAVTANGGYEGAGIGGGVDGAGGNISISGGTVTANGGADGGAGIGGGANGDGGNISISGGIVIANGNNFAACIGGGSFGSAGTIHISNGAVYAYNSGNYGQIGIGPGTNSSPNGSINITGGTVIASQTIGLVVGYSGGPTPVNVTGGAIITGSINATSFGQAQTLTGLTLSATLLNALAQQAMRMNDSLVVNIPTDTVYKNIEIVVPDSIAIVHDTIQIHYTAGHSDTIRIYITHTDTLYLERRDTVMLHDTFRLWQAGRDTIIVHDTTLLPREVITDLQQYIIIDGDSPGSAQQIANLSPHAGSAADGQIIITGLPAGQPFYIYDTDGRQLFSLLMPADNELFHLPPLPPATYLLYTSGAWSKFFVPY